MRTLILVFAFFILVINFQMCNIDNNVDSFNITPEMKKGELGRNDPPPCCNNSRPVNCSPTVIMGLQTICGHVEITQQCCCSIYEYYGNPPNLNGIQVPCTLICFGSDPNGDGK
jgi:hypothetical protein